MDFKFIDLFAGIGGFRLGMERAGFKCVFSSEIDKFARQTYEANHGDVPWGDICSIDVKDIPKFDMLCAGFPCQPFSKAGKRMGINDERGQLYKQILRILEHHVPSWIVLENVSKSVMDMIAVELVGYGYNSTVYKLNSADFGLAQKRIRYFLIARYKRGSDLGTLSDPNIHYKSVVLDILEDDVDDKYTLSHKASIGHLRRKRDNIASGKGFGYSMITHEGKYIQQTRTLTARYGKDGAEILIEQKARNPRKLTPRECARLMGFPDSFKIVCSDAQAYKQFGNSVCVPIVESIARKIKEINGMD